MNTMVLVPKGAQLDKYPMFKHCTPDSFWSTVVELLNEGDQTVLQEVELTDVEILKALFPFLPFKVQVLAVSSLNIPNFEWNTMTNAFEMVDIPDVDKASQKALDAHSIQGSKDATFNKKLGEKYE